MRIEIVNVTVAIVVLCVVRHKYHDVRVTLQLIEIYFRTLRHARVWQHVLLSGPSSICQKSTAYVRVIHTQMIKFSRLHATAAMPRIAGATDEGGNQYLYQNKDIFEIKYETLFGFCFQ